MERQAEAVPVRFLVSVRSLQSPQALTRPRIVRVSKTGPPRAPLDANPTSSKISVWKSRQFHTKDPSRAATRTFETCEVSSPGLLGAPEMAMWSDSLDSKFAPKILCRDMQLSELWHIDTKDMQRDTKIDLYQIFESHPVQKPNPRPNDPPTPFPPLTSHPV